MLFLIALMAGTTLTANAYTVVHTYIIDNDDLQGYQNDRYGFDTLFNASNLYYQDARRQVCNSEYNEYRYIFPWYIRYTKIYGKISAYLYDVSFTDPEACYFINDNSQNVLSSAGYINQDLAAPGWNVIGPVEASFMSADGKYATTFAEVIAGKNHATKNCGADAIKIELGY